MKELEYLDEDLVIEGRLYIDEYPNTLSNAIYNYGDNSIRTLLAYYECEDSGFILTDECLYLHLGVDYKISFNEIHHLIYNPKSKVLKINDFLLETDLIDLDLFSKLLNELTEITVELDLKDEEKIEYYVNLVIDDLLEDNYEDIILTNDDYLKIKEFKEEIALINTYEQVLKEEEYDQLNKHALEYFESLGLDSEEIEALDKIHQQHQNMNNQSFNQAMHQYDDLIDGFKNGNKEEINKVKSMAKMMGIDLDGIENKSPEELSQYIDELCNRFNISRSQLETLAKRFGK